MKRFFITFIAIVSSISIQSQTVDEILDNYFENIGGKEKLASVSSEINAATHWQTETLIL